MVQAAFMARQEPCAVIFEASRNVAIELAWEAQNCGRQSAVTQIGTQAQDARRDRAGQQDGSATLGGANEERGLQGSGAGSRGIMFMLS